jgi:hypothetical protein
LLKKKKAGMGRHFDGMWFSVGCSELRVCGRRFRLTDYYFPSAKNERRTERLCTTMTSVFMKQIRMDVARNFGSWLEYFMSNIKPPAGEYVLPKLDRRLTRPNSLDVIIRASKRNVILRITFPHGGQKPQPLYVPISTGQTPRVCCPKVPL